METSAALGKPRSDVVRNLVGLEEGKMRKRSLCQRLKRWRDNANRFVSAANLVDQRLSLWTFDTAIWLIP